MADAGLLYETLDHVIAMDAIGLWQQDYWLTAVDEDGDRTEPTNECRTAGCLAGWRAMLDGAKPLWDSYVEGRSHLVRLPEGEPVTVENHAKERLGLTSDQASALFNEHNSLADLKRIVDEIVAGQRYEDSYDEQGRECWVHCDGYEDGEAPF